MARAAAKGGKRPRQNARKPQPRPTASSSRRQLSKAEQGLFFTRIRRQAKWAYVLLAVLFAMTFAVLGVGSGQGGLDQIFNGIFGGSGGKSISSLKKTVAKQPTDAKAWNDLALAYGAKSRTQDAIDAMKRATALKPKDAAALTQLAQFQLQEAGAQATDWQAAQSYSNAWTGAAFRPLSATGKLGQGLGIDPFAQAAQTQGSTAQFAASTKRALAQATYKDALATYGKVAKLRPQAADVQLQIAGAAETALTGLQDVTFAKPEIAAYTLLEKLDPANKAQYRARVKQLKQFLPAPHR